jgi:hypothetical protein
VANEILLKSGVIIVFADTADHSPAAANNLGTRTDQIDLTSLGINAYRQSDKVDLGATRAAQYNIMAALEWASAPTAGGQVVFYWAPSPSATAANANPGGVSGSDAAYTGYSSNAANSIRQLMGPIGFHTATVQATTNVQIAFCGVFSPSERYGTLVVHNNTSQALVADAVEMSILLTPIVDEVQ